MMDIAYNAPTENDPNALLLVKKTKKRKSDGNKLFKESAPTKRQKELVKTKVDSKISKKKQRILANKKSLREKKEKRADLIAELQKYQSNTIDLGLNVIDNSASKVGYNRVVRKKLRSVAGPKLPSNEQNAVWQNTTHYETDSGDDDDLEEELFTHFLQKPKYKEPKQEEIDMLHESPTVQIDSDEESKAPTLKQQRRQKIQVDRNEAIEIMRSKLPIFAEEQQIVEAINENDVVILCGETGSGKSTQVPQMLYEAGYTQIFAKDDDIQPIQRRIVITQPRRVAAVNMAARVKEELNEPSTSKLVAHHIRFDADVDTSSQIVFLTDGVLLRQMQSNLTLSNCSVVIIDEAHDRSVSSDILIGLLSRVVRLRRKRSDPLKLIIMSATLRTADFTQPLLFPEPGPKIIKVDARQYQVTVYFDRHTQCNYIKAAYDKVVKVHKAMPPDGAILVFVTGQKEVNHLVHSLRKRFAHISPRIDQESKRGIKKRKKKAPKCLQNAKHINLDDYAKPKSTISSNTNNTTPEVIEGIDTDELANDLCNEDQELDLSDYNDDQSDEDTILPLYVLPLYSLMVMQEQQKVFQPPPEGYRMCVVATNVAETSLTIPNVKYVIDSGKCKRRLRDPVTGISRFVVDWASKASVDQRAGRAGRIAPGHCFRLYSSAVFEHDLPQYTTPDIVEKPVDELTLHMHAMGIVHVKRFPFVTPPSPESIDASIEHLKLLGAIEPRNLDDNDTMCRITSLGRSLALLPVAPNYGKLLALASQHKNLLPYAVILVALLGCREPYLPINIDGECTNQTERKGAADKKIECTCVICIQRRSAVKWLSQRRKWSRRSIEWEKLADLGALIQSYIEAEATNLNDQECFGLGVRLLAMKETRQQRRQLTSILNRQCRLKTELLLEQNIKPPTNEVCRLLRQCICAAMCDQLAMRAALLPPTTGEISTSDNNKLEISRVGVPYRTSKLLEMVYCQQTSLLYSGRGGIANAPDLIIYQQLIDYNGRKEMRMLCSIDLAWPAEYAPQYCTFEGNIPESKENFIYYSYEKDAMVQRYKCFLAGKWLLSDTVERATELDMYAYTAFFRDLMEGKIFSSLVAFADKWLYRPAVVCRTLIGQASSGALQRRNQRSVLSKAFDLILAHRIATRQQLKEIWAQQQEFLCEEFSDLLPMAERDKLRLIWPPKDN